MFSFKKPHRFTVALVGRPNVGKSSLFNRLTGTRFAIVHDQPGVTRDWREGTASLGGLDITVLDTAGWEEAVPGTFDRRIQVQTNTAVGQADMVVMLTDGRAGLLPDDYAFAEWLHSVGKPVVLAVNKCENREQEMMAQEAWALGLGEPIPLSAAHGGGVMVLWEAILQHYPKNADGEPEVTEDEKPIQVAIVGRPNAGKSTLLNALLKQERVLTGPEPGITRDAIAVSWEWKGRALTIVDTAGMRKRGQVDETLEKMAVEDARRVIRYAQVVVLMIDASMPLEKQDLTIARHVEEEGRALVIALNKWDLIEDKDALLRHVRQRLQITLPQVYGVPVVTLSALYGRQVDKVLDTAMSSYDLWNTRYPTAALNRFLQAAIERHPPPLVNARRIKLQYMTQVKSRPPSFVIFCTKAAELPDSYTKYLTTALRQEFNLPGVPIRITLRNKKNPYADED